MHNAKLRAQRDQEHAAAVAKALRESDDQQEQAHWLPGTLPGDARKLRGIPAIGRNVAGAINGTNPESIAA